MSLLLLFPSSALAPPFVSGSSKSTNNVGIDVGAQGDVLIAFVDSGAGNTGPAGWTVVPGGGETQWIGPYYKTIWTIKRGAAAPALTWGNAVGILICAVRRADPTTWIDVNASITLNSSSPSSTSAGLTTVTNNALILTNISVYSTGLIAGPPSGFTIDALDTGFGLGTADKQLSVAGPTGSITWQLSPADVTVNSVVAIRGKTNNVAQHRMFMYF